MRWVELIIPLRMSCGISNITRLWNGHGKSAGQHYLMSDDQPEEMNTDVKITDTIVPFEKKIEKKDHTTQSRGILQDDNTPVLISRVEHTINWG